MPELPEVETIVRDIRPALLGRRIERVALSHDDVLRGVTPPRLVRGLTGATVRDVFRRAKHAVIDLGDAPAGGAARHDRLAHRAPPAAPAGERRYAVLRAALDNGRELVYATSAGSAPCSCSTAAAGTGTARRSDPSRWSRSSRRSGSGPRSGARGRR